MPVMSVRFVEVAARQPRLARAWGYSSATCLSPWDNLTYMIIRLRFPDPEYAETFRAYSNYLVDLASDIGGRFGWGGSLVEGVLDGVSLHLAQQNIKRRSLTPPQLEALDGTLRKAWGNIRRLRREVDDLETFDEESNAWLPVQAYYAVYHATRAYAVASNQQLPHDHRRALNLISKEVVRGLLPSPWSAYCDGCPNVGAARFGGLGRVEPVHVLSAPDPGTTSDRLALFLRTTREKELERRFRDERRKKLQPGATRRNLSRATKEHLARNLQPTTIFDLFWRLRTKANYDDADAFVLGAAGMADARAFGDSIAIVTDATVGALEGLILAHVGPDPYGELVERYRRRTNSAPDSPIGLRAALFATSSDSTTDDAPF